MRFSDEHAIFVFILYLCVVVSQWNAHLTELRTQLEQAHAQNLQLQRKLAATQADKIYGMLFNYSNRFSSKIVGVLVVYLLSKVIDVYE